MKKTQGSAEERWRDLADGHRIPRLGLGVWQIPNGSECVDAVRWALEVGYRHIDTAQAYGNEDSVGKAVEESGIPREEVFITTKFDPDRDDPVKEAHGSLQRLKVDYIDLYLVHWPRGGPILAWPGMEKAHEQGLARSIGVSNFGSDELGALMSSADIPPVVDQVLLSPFDYREALLEYASDRGIAVEAYSPLGTGKHLKDITVQNIADSVGRTSAQVLLRWAIQHDLIVLPKSTHRDRIEANAQIFDFFLSSSEMGELDALDRTNRSAKALERTWW